MQQQAENSWFFTKPDPDLEGAAEESLEDPIQAAGEVIKDEIAMTTFTGIDPFSWDAERRELGRNRQVCAQARG